MEHVQQFLDDHCSHYPIECIQRDTTHTLVIPSCNMHKNGRVPDYLISWNDLVYFDNVLATLTFNGNMWHDLDKIVKWIQYRLNVKQLHGTDFTQFNLVFLQHFFNCQTWTEFYAKNNDIVFTNLRHVYFGDCRECEIFIHVMTTLYLQKYHVSHQFHVYRFYATGHSQSFVWEHTHSILYDKMNNKLYCLDALCHSTYKHPFSSRQLHALELEIKNKKTVFFKNYSSVKYANYYETPTTFSKLSKFITIQHIRRTYFYNLIL